MRAKQRSDRDLGTVHALNYFATSEIAGKILITKFPKFLEETKKEKEEREKKRKKWKKRRKRRGSFETRREKGKK